MKLILMWIVVITTQGCLLAIVVDLVFHHIDYWTGKYKCSSKWYCLPLHHIRIRINR